MAARAIWKGVLKIGPSNLPVKLYAGVEDRDVHFHVLQGQTKTRVRQRMVRDTGDVVAREDIRKGYEIEPGTFVIVDEEELQQFKPKESRDIEAMRFVPTSKIANHWYERPYYVGPDDDADLTYFALVEALQ